MNETRPHSSIFRRGEPGSGSRLFGYSMYDFANSAFATTILAVLFNKYFAGVVAGGEEGVPIFGTQVPGATVYSWMVSLSMVLIVLSGPFLGVLADRGGARIRFLTFFWLPGVAGTFCLSMIGPGDWILGGALFCVTYYCFAASSIFYNALLPEVAPRERLGRASGIAWGVGYLGGALLLVANLIMLENPQLLGFPEGTFEIRDTFTSVAIWWLLFTIPMLWIFRFEARRPVPQHGDFGKRVRESLRQVRVTFRSLTAQPNLRRYFLAYLIYNDGVQTVVAMASIFGAQELGMENAQLILFFLLIQVTAFIGAFSLGSLADRKGHKRVLLVSVGAWAVLTSWAYFLGIFGDALQEYWVLGGIAGIFLGGIQTCSRSLVAHWIPESRESEFFGFFSIMTRVAAVFGPLLYGGLVLATGSLRLAILSVASFFIVGGILLSRVKTDEIETERLRLSERTKEEDPDFEEIRV